MVKRSVRDEVVTVKVRDIAAQCPHCGETRFRRRIGAGAGGADSEALYSCLSCHAAVSRVELLNQIGEEAVRRARLSRESARKEAGRPKKRR